MGNLFIFYHTNPVVLIILECIDKLQKQKSIVSKLYVVSFHGKEGQTTIVDEQCKRRYNYTTNRCWLTDSAKLINKLENKLFWYMWRFRVTSKRILLKYNPVKN